MTIREKLHLMAEIERRNRDRIESFSKARKRPSQAFLKKTMDNSPGAQKPQEEPLQQPTDA